MGFERTIGMEEIDFLINYIVYKNIQNVKYSNHYHYICIPSMTDVAWSRFLVIYFKDEILSHMLTRTNSMFFQLFKHCYRSICCIVKFFYLYHPLTPSHINIWLLIQKLML